MHILYIIHAYNNPCCRAKLYYNSFHLSLYSLYLRLLKTRYFVLPSPFVLLQFHSLSSFSLARLFSVAFLSFLWLINHFHLGYMYVGTTLSRESVVHDDAMLCRPLLLAGYTYFRVILDFFRRELEFLKKVTLRF